MTINQQESKLDPWAGVENTWVIIFLTILSIILANSYFNLNLAESHLNYNI